MAMQQHDLKAPKGAKKNRKRIGRGDSSGNGSFSGKGMKGQKLAYQETGVSASNIEDLVLKGELLNLNYLISNQHSTFYYPYIDQVYHNEKQYSYLIKIFDSDEYGYKKLKIKVFEINYEQFHKNFETQN